MSELSYSNWNFSVDGMHCVKCIRKIQSIGSVSPGVSDLKIDFDKKLVSAQAASNFNPNQFVSKINEAGFQARLISNMESTQKQRGNKMFLARVGLAGACAGNIMLIAISGYAGASKSEFGELFRWLSFAFYLPVLFFCAWPFLENSYLALKQRRVSVDVPLTLAILGASGISTWNLFTGAEALYFDSLSMFIFFLLSSRYLIHRLQDKYLSPVQLEDVFSQQFVSRRTVGGGEELVSIGQLAVGDTILINKGEFVPADGILKTPIAEFSNAFLTGESLPVTLLKFANVFAGSKLISPKAELELSQVSASSRISELIRKINLGLNTETTRSLLADKGAHYLSLVVVFVAVVFFTYFAFTDVIDALDRILALLVIACPCALAIATPLAHSLTVKKGLEHGILFKSPQAIEDIYSCDAVVFDKTGTLTDGVIKIISWPLREPNELEKRLIFSMEKNSEHPIAIALKRAVGECEILKLENLREVAGTGIIADYNGSRYELKSTNLSQEREVVLAKDGQVILTAKISDHIRDDAKSIIKGLKKANKKCFLLSGDGQSISVSVGKSLGLQANEILANYSPEDKANFIKDLQVAGQRVLFVGDGINDALALSCSNVSISMQSSAEATFRSSNIHLLNGGLSALSKAFTLSKNCLSTIRINIILSTLYNLFFAVFALCGWIDPVVAVVIMPISSLTVVALTFFNITKGKI